MYKAFSTPHLLELHTFKTVERTKAGDAEHQELPFIAGRNTNMSQSVQKKVRLFLPNSPFPAITYRSHPFEYFLKSFEKLYPYSNVYTSFIYNCPSLNTKKTPFRKWWSVVHLDNGQAIQTRYLGRNLFSHHEKSGKKFKYIPLSWRSKSEKNLHIGFNYVTFQKRQISEISKVLSGRQDSLEEEVNRWSTEVSSLVKTLDVLSKAQRVTDKESDWPYKNKVNLLKGRI